MKFKWIESVNDYTGQPMFILPISICGDVFRVNTPHEDGDNFSLFHRFFSFHYFKTFEQARQFCEQKVLETLSNLIIDIKQNTEED